MKKAYLQLHSAVLLASCSGILGNLILLDAVLVTWYRMLLAGLVLIALLLVRERRPAFSRTDLHVLATGALLALHWIFFYASIKYSNVSVGVVCFCLSGFFTAIVSPLLNRQRDKFARMIDSLDQLNATTRYNLQERLDGMTKEFKVCHGDFNPSNVIVGDDGQLYVCDWAHATQGSPAADVATTYLLFALNSKDQAEAYLELYCDRADMPMQVVRQWTSIVAASELARKRNVNDEFLKNWIDVVDYQ